MRRLTILIAALALVAAACGGKAAPASTPAPATPAPAAPAPASEPKPAPAASPSAAPRLIPATVTFDGSTCTYAGPTVVPTGSVIEWTLVNTPAALDESIGGGLLVLGVQPGTTWDDIVAWHEVHPSLFDFPPWLARGRWPQYWSPEHSAAGGPMQTLAGPHALLVNCANEDGENPRAFPAVLIQALKG